MKPETRNHLILLQPYADPISFQDTFQNPFNYIYIFLCLTPIITHISEQLTPDSTIRPLRSTTTVVFCSGFFALNSLPEAINQADAKINLKTLYKTFIL